LRTIGPHELKERFPKLVQGSFERKSNATARYNCIAFAAGDERHWWEAGANGGRYYWPPSIRQSTTVDGVAEIFTAKGFELTNNRDVESGYEKVAIYVSMDDFEFSHIAVSDGTVWKSKLGKGQDIEHCSLDVLEGDQKDEYGIVDRILRNPLKGDKK
jgi:hypothetical protein